MGLLRTVALVVLSTSFVVFVALFGRLPAFRKTPIGWLHRLICVHLPHGLVALDRRLTGGRLGSGAPRFFDYIMNEPHPLVMIFFLALQAGGELLFIPSALPYITARTIHCYAVPILVILPYLCLYFCYVTRSTVSSKNHSSSVAAYPYDYVLYHPNMDCRTCHLPKPPRSKHCSICKVCVQKQDHHCIWINNCVGRNNAAWFMALLLTIAILLLYASVLGYGILDGLLQTRFVPLELTRGSATAKRWSTKLTWWQWLDAWGLVISKYPGIGATTLLCIMCFPLAGAFFIYHIYLLWAGMTTNESAKWGDLREDIIDGLVWKARIDDVKQDYPQDIDDRLNPGTVDWPVKPEWWIIRSRGGRQPTRQVWAGKEGEVEPDHRWHKVRNLKRDVDNVYDIGFVASAKDLLFNRG